LALSKAARLRDRLLSPLALLRHRGFFTPAIGFAPLPLLLELRCRFAGSLVAALGAVRFLSLDRLFPCPFALEGRGISLFPQASPPTAR